ncbi:MAG: hypothetical protein ABL888_11525 [Pirellulaceae bacterium]
MAGAIGFKLTSRNDLPDYFVNPITCTRDDVAFVQTKQTARSTRQALTNGRKKLGIGVDTFNLYNNSAVLKVMESVCFKKQGQTDLHVIDLAQQAFRRLYPRSQASRDALETIALSASNQLEDRVINALELHSIAIASSEPRVKLVNLWSALECLAGCCERKTVIERVLQLVTPLLIWRRFDKTVRYAAISTARFGSTIGQNNYGSGFTRSNVKFVHPLDMMISLCRPKDHEDIVSLLSFCSKHPFLVHRIYRLWKEFSDPTNLLKASNRSQERIKWQVYRIYRARNLLVHHGIEIPELPSLLDNLQYYSSVVLQRLIHAMKQNHGWQLRESLEYWNAKSGYVLSALESRPNILRVSDFFPMTSEKNSPQLWAPLA